MMTGGPTSEMRALYENKVVLLQMEQVRDESFAWFRPGYLEVRSVIRIRPGYQDQTDTLSQLVLNKPAFGRSGGYHAPKVLI